MADEKTKKPKPARRQSSMRGATYQRLKNYCQAKGVSMSSEVERWIEEDLDSKGVPVPKPEDCPQKKEKLSKDEAEERRKSHFTP